MSAYSFYPSDCITPAGWLRRQLELQANGLSGNLDKVWPDVRDSAWIGGDREGWERVPYWLDGFIPLAYLLRNDDMIARAKNYVDSILARQREDGWSCPCKDEDLPTYDTWAVLLISKVLVEYYRCSRDERIPDALYRMMKNYYELLKSGKIHLFSWGKARWFEGFIAINFLRERYADPFLRELAEILASQGYDYTTDDAVGRFVRPMNQWTFETHVVNLGMMFKAEAVSHSALGKEYTDSAERLWDIIMRHNGTPAGIFTGDEVLSGLSPIQGTELCAVAELMYSFEWLFAETGDPKWAERLEKAAFNALPATISDDMWAHQYDQLSNQIACVRFPGKPLFRTNGAEAHLFGLEPNYGCCTANFGQAWPKFALSAYMYSGDKVISVLPIPSKLNAGGVSVELVTDYPFKNVLEYTVSTDKDIEFEIRIPGFAENLRVNGKQTQCEGILTLPLKAGEKSSFRVEFDATPKLINRPYGLYTAQCGSLVFSLPISYEKKMLEYERNGVERKFPYCDYEYIGTSEWRYGYSDAALERVTHEIADVPFSSEKPAVTLRAHVKRIPWDFADGYDSVAEKVPSDRRPCGAEETVDLFPYGCAKLRMTELPMCEE